MMTSECGGGVVCLVESSRLTTKSGLILGMVLMVLCSVVSGGDDDITGDVASRRRFFTRYASKRLSSIQSGALNNTSVDGCMLACLTTHTLYQCRSFDYDNRERACSLFSVGLSDTDVRLIDSADKDHYETTYVKAFRRLPKHSLPGPSALILPDPSSDPSSTLVTVEQCSMHCLLASQFYCMGFNYRRSGEGVGASTGEGGRASAGGVAPPQCSLLARGLTESRTGVVVSEVLDYYERLSDGPLSSFINYGVGTMVPLTQQSVYDLFIADVDLPTCAQLCVNQTSFQCQSFDFIYDFKRPPPNPASADPPDQSAACQLSRWAAASVGGLMIDNLHPKRNHYERIGPNLEYFYAVPWAVLRGGDRPKSYQPISIEQCALQCLRETTFICRSFDYVISDGGSCVLSSRTSSDPGGELDTRTATQPHIQTDTHHFEMKPMLDCGGVMTSSTGNLATPHWPQPYSHHERCEWDIRAPEHQVIHLTLTHFDLGEQSKACSEAEDKLTVEEAGSRPYCLQADTRTLTTRTNRLVLRFVSDSKHSAAGFRAFYTTDWPCDGLLAPPRLGGVGMFATPHWPISYTPGERCTWRISSPSAGLQVHLRIKPFQLMPHPLGHCTAQSDHLRLLDGGTAAAAVIGQYCGDTQNEISVRSSGRDLVVQFYSDSASSIDEGRGFLAQYWYETTNGTVWGDVSTNKNSSLRPRDEVKSINQSDLVFGENSLDDSGHTGAVRGVASDDRQTEGRGLWAAVVILMLMVAGLVVALLLIVRHYRQRLAGGKQKQVIVEGELQTLRGEGDEEGGEQSVTQFSHAPRPVSNNRAGPRGKQQPYNNIVDLSATRYQALQAPHTGGPTANKNQAYSTERAEGGATGSSTNHTVKDLLLAEDKPINGATAGMGPKSEEDLTPPPRAPMRTHRPLSSYGKYHSDNAHNMHRENRSPPDDT